MEFVALLKIELLNSFSPLFMKKLLFLVLLLSTFFGYAQYTLIPDANFEKALINDGIDSGVPDGKVLTSSVKNLTVFKANGAAIKDLTGIQDFVNLLTLTCINNQLTKLDISKNIVLQSLSCDDNKLTTLDLSNNKDLQFVDCGSNLLTNLDLSKNTALTNLYCYSNQLKILDVTKNIELLLLYCTSNQLATLDLSKNTKLRVFSCVNNPITDLDLSNNKSLESVGCNINLLTNLNLKNGNNTKLTSVDFTNNPNLTCIQVDNKAYSDANWSSKKDATASYSEDCSKTTNAIQPPEITAIGNQTYCPGTSLKIVESINITTDPLEPDTDAIYIQIAAGYVNGEDKLELANLPAHPTITRNWDAATGKLKLFSPTGNKIPYSDFVSAIYDVEFSNSSTTPSGTRNFSITIGQANYLPSTGHYYQYVSNLGITWTSAKTAAEALNYYGLKGYLATLLSLEEAKISGEQAQGAGWIGGSDSVTEGEWRWVTGPEGLANGGNGIVFWNGTGNGSTPNFAYWNSSNGEPNNLGDEDYAHIKSNNVSGIPGSWNDLSNTGSSSGDYQPKGFIVEFGGMAGDPVLKISASTTMKMSQLTVTTPSPICFGEKATLQASAGSGTINWYDIGGVLLKTGTNFTTPALTTDTTYYVDNGCPTRFPITVTVNTIPIITSTNTPISLCGSGPVTLQATSTSGTINWYASKTGSTVVATGSSFPIPNITANTTYYAEAFNNGCSDGNRLQVDVLVYTKPVVVDQEVTKCKSSDIELDAGVPGMFYSWSTGEKTQKITVLTSGIYSVVVTSPAPENCSSTKKITVFEYDVPEIDRIDVNETTVVIYLKKDEPYFEYSVDGINYQNSNVFFNVQGGLQTAYVRETNLCSIDSQTFSVLIIPKYFTPNGDTYNDYWEVKGLNNYPKAEVSIFDRYGKLISVLNGTKANWDGMLNKNPLPSDDYWYVLRIDENSPEKRGHFSLKR